MSGQIILTFKHLSNFYQYFIYNFSKIIALLTVMLKINPLMDLSTNAAQIIVEYNRVNNGGCCGKLLKKLSKVKKNS